jgi:hypothetical protein
MMHEGVERETYFQWLSQAAPDVQLHHLMAGHWISSAIHVAAELKLADRLAAGPQSSTVLAQQTQTQPQALYRLLRTLASVGLFTEVEPGSFALTELGGLLTTDHPRSMRALTRYGSSWMQWQRCGALQRAVETGGSVDREVLGMSGSEYRNHHPEERAIFNEAMVSLVRQVVDAVVRAYDFSRFQTLVDVGGGYGALLSAILRSTPGLRGVLFDRPEVAEGATRHLAAAGVLDRCAVVGGDMFAEIPQGGDAYMFSRVIHDRGVAQLPSRDRAGRDAGVGRGGDPTRGCAGLRQADRSHHAGRFRRAGAHRGRVSRAVYCCRLRARGGDSHRVSHEHHHRRPASSTRGLTRRTPRKPRVWDLRESAQFPTGVKEALAMCAPGAPAAPLSPVPQMDGQKVVATGRGMV